MIALCAGRVEEAAAERVRGRERDRVQRRRRAPPQRSLSDSVDAARSLGLVDVELEHVDRRRQPLRRRARSSAGRGRSRVRTISAPVLLRLRARRAKAIESAGEHAGDQQPLALQDRHSGMFPAGQRRSGADSSAASGARARASRSARSPRRRTPRPSPRSACRCSARVARRRARRARASGSSAAAISRRLMIPTAGRAPITPELAPRARRSTKSAPEVLAVHRDEGAAEGLAQDHRHARHRAAREKRVHELRAVADHAGSLLLGARQEAGRVDQHEQRHPERGCRCARSGPPSASASTSSTPPR